MSSLSDQIEERSLSGYDSSKYYPAMLGELIHGTYTPQAKLGYGRMSTTWLCKDKTDAFRVLKLSTASDGMSQEARVFKHLEDNDANSQKHGRYCVRRPEDMFTISSAGGQHYCFVFEPLGPSLLEFVSHRATRTFHIEEVRRLSIYLLHALDFLHSHDVIHTDIKLDNIQLTLPDNEDEILASFVADGMEITSASRTSSGDPLIYKSREMRQKSLTFPILCDLGSAKVGTPPHQGLIQALPYRAPEIILGARWNSKVDIWSLGVLFWEMIFRERLFGQTSQTDALKLMFQYLGPPPEMLLTRCSRQDEYLDLQGNFKGQDVSLVVLEDRVEVETPIPVFFDFVRSMLQWDPNDRLSASELLQHPWLNSS